MIDENGKRENDSNALLSDTGAGSLPDVSAYQALRC